VRGFSALVAASAVVLLIASSASASPRPRVLAVHFALDINPVSQDYVNHQIDRAPLFQRFGDQVELLLRLHACFLSLAAPGRRFSPTHPPG